VPPPARSSRLLPALYEGRASLTTDDRVLAHDELAGAVGAVAAAVAGAHTVAVATDDPMSTLVAVAGVIAAGAAAIPISARSTVPEREHIVRDCGPDLVIEQVALDASAPLPADRSADTDPALILYTSGSTGQPKGVVLSRRAIAFDLDALAKVWAWSADDVLVHALPLSHVHGLVFGGLGPLRIGSPLTYVAPTLRPVEGATVYFAVPAIWNSLPDAQVRALNRARLLVSGAAPLPKATFERVEELSGHRIVDRYAMTETLVNTAPALSDRERRPGSLGRPLPGVDIELRDAGTGDGAGEIHVRGPNLFSGYLGHPGALDHDGWFATGDLGRWNDDGSLRLTGRCSTDNIKTAGYRVGAGEVEDALLSHPAVREAAVIGLPDKTLGERVAAWVVLSESLHEDVLVEHLAARLSAFKRPREIHVIDALPRNHLGKIQKSRLR
jgi:acyl-CoA synthetase (AMP-forming)/AMP-acid ligase II